MRASNWEFKNRAVIFGLIFGCAFACYGFDHQNAAATVADWLAPKAGIDATLLARLLIAIGALILIAGALVRTWASAYLESSVVYAAEVKSDALVADGPYRHVRNPLYFGNVLLAVGLGPMMSRIGFFVAVAAMLAFCYRLILREELDLESTQGAQYDRYRREVPRLSFSPGPRIPSSGRQADWAAGFRAELWCWGYGLAVATFAATLSSTAFFVILAASIFLLFLPKKSRDAARSSER